MSDASELPATPAWMRTCLRLAGAYNLTWGLSAIALPNQWFAWFGMDPPRYPEFWQCIGMIVGVYGIGYLIAARDPVRHWPIVLVGLLGKLFGPIGFVGAVITGRLPLAFGATIITNDLIWWVPFGYILWHAWSVSMEPSTKRVANDGSRICSIIGDNGLTLHEMSCRSPVLVVFLRHAGCTFHRQTMADLKHVTDQLLHEGYELAIVHMSQGDNPSEQLEEYQLPQVARFSDPTCSLYREFGLQRGTFRQLLGPRVWLSGLIATLQGHRFGGLLGDALQMPGVFLLKDGRIVHQYRHRTAGDRPDYLSIARGWC